VNWTSAQAAAIEARGSNLLVSAAAGSGKTAVLAARILSLVQEGTRVDELLVVTFTKAAAAEMRVRILEMLHETAGTGGARLVQEAMRVEHADISTLHGFCAKVCRDHFQAALVDPSFRVGDTAEIGVLAGQAMEEALIACFEAPTPAFAHASACLTRKELAEAAEGLHTFLMARPDPWDWLSQVARMYEMEEEELKTSPWMEALLDTIRLEAETAVYLYERVAEFAGESGLYAALTLEEVRLAESFLFAAREGIGALEASSLHFGRKPPKKKDAAPWAEERYTSLRDAAKAALQTAGKRAEQVGVLLTRREELQAAGLLLRGIGEAARAFDACFTRLKEERDLKDFSDLEHCTLRALRDAEVASALQESYKYIFIDEYQDASQIQEEILAHIRRMDNLFMVGDVKQSIYRFRLAEPGLFLRKLARFSHEEGSLNRRIDLNANFRSHKNLLRCINDVFESVFCGGVMEVAYDDSSRLHAGNETEAKGGLVELHLIDATEDAQAPEEEDAPTAEELTPEVREAVQWEAEVIAERILALRDEGYAFRDMAVLMRTVKGKAVQVAQVLRERGVNARTDLGGSTLQRPEVQAVLAMLRSVDNLRQDVPLLAALKGPAVRLTEEALAEIRSAHPEGTFAEAMLAYAERDNALATALRGFIQKMRDWALDAQVLPLDSLLRRLYHETGYYAEVGALPDGLSRQANLRALAEYAGVYQRTQAKGLSGFLRYLERVKAHEGLAAVELSEADDAVRVLSIHKSKGLQFPVVFVAGMGSAFRLRDTGLLQVHQALGVALPTINPTLRTKWTTLAREAIVEKRKQEALAEEARVLYVAMTRAQKRLILVGTQKAGDEDRWRRPQTLATVANARSQLDWVAPSAWGTPSAWGAPADARPGWAVTVHVRKRCARILQDDLALAALVEKARAHVPADSAVVRALAWKPALLDHPLKQSVTALLKEERKRGEEADTGPELSALARRPLFMEERGLTAAERGDAVHIFLRAVPLDARDVSFESRNMVERGILSEEQAASLPLLTLESCLRSESWRRMRSAEEVRREWAFNLRVMEQGKRTLLQGIIDACFVEGNAWVVMDYKTDHALDVEKLTRRYKPQIDLYAQALEKITGKRVKERILFLIEAGEGYKI